LLHLEPLLDTLLDILVFRYSVNLYKSVNKITNIKFNIRPKNMKNIERERNTEMKTIRLKLN